MPEWFPSREWLDAYRRALNGNEAYRRASEGWGVDFAGDFVFEITDVPIGSTTFGDLPDGLADPLRTSLESLPEERIDALVADAPPGLDERLADRAGPDRARLVEALLDTPLADDPSASRPGLRAAFPRDLARLLDQLERYVHDGTIHAYLDLHDGDCREAAVLEDPSARDPGFRIAGPYWTWRDLLEGADVMDAVFSQALDLDGSTTTIIPYADAAAELGDTAGRVESRYLF